MKKWKTNTKFQALNAMLQTVFITQRTMLVKQAELKLVLAVIVAAQPTPAVTLLKLKTNL